MTRDDILAILETNLRGSGLSVEAVRAQQDPRGDWAIAVVSPEYVNLSAARRREITLKGLEEISLHWVDLLTPAEMQWSGRLPSAEPGEQLPLWPEALARSKDAPDHVRFPSDEDDDLDLPVVVTFYSFRGGVGRSTAVAHTARLLASQRKKIVCVDMDLEAPGLAALFGCDDDIDDDQGVVRLLLDLDQGDEPHLADHLLKVTEEHDLYLLPGGRVSSDYARRLRLLDPNAWYREEGNPLRSLLEKLRTDLPFSPDAILIDARTGITPMSAPLLFELADVAVVVFFPHPQARRGTELLVRGLLSSKTWRPHEPRFSPEIRFIASPLPAARKLLEQYERRTADWIADWLVSLNALRPTGEPIDERDIMHTVSYQESIAASDTAQEAAANDTAFEPVRDWVLRYIPSPREDATEAGIRELKPSILRQLTFTAGTAETQTDFLSNFVQTEVIREAAQGVIPLVLGRKGSGKTAIFRWLIESKTVDSVVVHAPAGLGQVAWAGLSSTGFREAERITQESQATWHTFWAVYICAALRRGLPLATPVPAFLNDTDAASEHAILETLRSVAAEPAHEFELTAWLRAVDAALPAETFLLFDGLDTGFGSTMEERHRRRQAVEGLFALWMGHGQSLNQLRFKILLREDIWRQLRFENKSHLYGRSVLLRWPDQATYFKVVLKQAARAPAFRKLLEMRPAGKRLLVGAVDDWPSDDVWEAWTVLVGERMKGGKTAFTRNWVWNRLSDANDDHTPRHLLQLFHAAVPWERSQHAQSPYDRSVLRPRALIERLSSVSEEALGALQEEFGELEPLLDALKKIARTPVEAETLEDLTEAVDLAREVGLLGVYEEKDEGIQRYKVPDIYRLALGMTRRGQA